MIEFIGLFDTARDCNLEFITTHRHRSGGTVVSITTGYGLDDQGVGVRVSIGSSIFPSPNRPDRH
jgi:hypothetical protein